MNAPAAPAKPKPAAKPKTVTISLEVTYPAKDNMTLADFAAEGETAKKVVEGARLAVASRGASATGSVAIGTQKFPL